MNLLNFYHILIAALTLFYAVFLFRFIIGLFRLGKCEISQNLPVAVIIPARNEEENIGSCLTSIIKLDYPENKLEVLVVNDESTDDTQKIVDSFAEKCTFIKSVNTKDLPKKYMYKKNALYQGIINTESEIIATVDADCVAQPGWLKIMTSCFDEKTGVVAGPVQILKSSESSFLKKIESLDFLSLVICGAGSIGCGFPLIANGANFMYRRKTYEETGGFDGIDTIASGDDDLFIQKVHKHGKWKVKFCPSKNAVNYTSAADSAATLLKQRTRWATKGIRYKNRSLVLTLGSIYLFYLYLFFGIPAVLFLNLPAAALITAWIIKLLFEAGVLLSGMRLLGRFDLLKYFPFAEIVHVPYILIASLTGLFNSITWKGRKIKNS